MEKERTFAARKEWNVPRGTRQIDDKANDFVTFRAESVVDYHGMEQEDSRGSQRSVNFVQQPRLVCVRSSTG